MLYYLPNLHKINVWWNRSSSHHVWLSVYFKRIIWIIVLLVLRLFNKLTTSIRHHFINGSILLWMAKISSLWLNISILTHHCCSVLWWSVILITNSYHVTTSWWLALIITHIVTYSYHVAATGWLTLIITNSVYVATSTSFILNPDHIATSTYWTLIIRYLIILIGSKKLAALFWF
jgi:hypothetical protein